MVLSIEIKKAMKREMSLEEHLNTIYNFLYEIADELEEMDVEPTHRNENMKNIKIKIR